MIAAINRFSVKADDRELFDLLKNMNLYWLVIYLCGKYL